MSTDYQQLIEAFNEVVRVASKHQVTAPRMKSVLERAIAALDDFITHYDPQLVEPRSPADAGYENRKTFEKVFIAQERTILRKLDLTEDSCTALPHGGGLSGAGHALGSDGRRQDVARP